MSFSVEQRNGSEPDTLILRPEGPLTVSSLPEFSAALRLPTERLLVLDLSGIPHMDSAGLGSILTLHSTLLKAGRRLTLASPTKRVQMLITLTKVDTVLNIFPSVEAAENA